MHTTWLQIQFNEQELLAQKEVDLTNAVALIAKHNPKKIIILLEATAKATDTSKVFLLSPDVERVGLSSLSREFPTLERYGLGHPDPHGIGASVLVGTFNELKALVAAK